jgi:hypothetical protein
VALQFTLLGAEHFDAVRSFNERMRAGKAQTAFLVPESAPEGAEESAKTSGPVQQRQYIALDGEGVHGGVIEMEQPGWLDGHLVQALNYQSPLSEGILDRRYGMVAVRMVKFMEARGDSVFIVGMGAETNPMPRMLKASGWTVRAVPFLFRVHRTGTFLREMQMLNSTRARRIAARVAAGTGIASLALACAQMRRAGSKFKVRRESEWGNWANEVWTQCRNNCSFAAAREQSVLEALYPSKDPRLSILVVEHGGDPVGWAACFDTRFKDRKYFGDMRLGCVVDCMARPDAMTATAIAADAELASRGADLVWLNHSHAAWVRAFRSAGFLKGPSNYQLGTSKPLTQAILSAPGGEDAIHVTRGDGDGRANFV